MPAVGFAMGVERLMLELETQGLDPGQERHPDLFIASFPSTTADALVLAQQLIREGFAVETDIMGRSLRAQMKAADRREARFILVLGDTEIAEGRGRLRRLSDGSESEILLTEIPASLV